VIAWQILSHQLLLNGLLLSHYLALFRLYLAAQTKIRLPARANEERHGGNSRARPQVWAETVPQRARGVAEGSRTQAWTFIGSSASSCLVNVHTNYKTPFFVLEKNLFLFFLKNLFKPCLFMRRRQEKSKEGRGGGRGESCSDCFCGEGARRKHTSRRRGCRRQVGPGARLRPELCRARILPLLRRRSGWRWVDAELEGPLRGQIGTTYVPTQSRRRTHSHSLPPVGRRRACAPSSAGTNLDRREELLALRRGASPPR